MSGNQVWDDEYEVVVIGSGAAALAGAYTAARRGLKTLLVEKTNLLGGASAYSGASCWLPGTQVQQRAEVEDSGHRCVMANSALRRAYRDRLRGSAPTLVIAFLDGSHDLIADRQAHRHHEYMPSSLLDSQFATLERPQPDEAAVTVSIEGSVDETVAAILAALSVTSG